MDDLSNEKAPADTFVATPDATPLPAIPAGIDDILNRWWSTTVQSVGPLISTQAYGALCTANDNLRYLFATALR